MRKIVINEKVYEIDGILFDKDGTLVDFGSLWITWTKDLIDKIVHKTDISCNKETYANALGFSYEERTWDPKGPLAIGSLQDIISILSRELYSNGVPWNDAFKLVNDSYQEVESDFNWHDSVKAIRGLRDFLQQASNRSIKMGVVTSDNYDRARHQLKLLEIDHYFSAIVGHDSVEQGKPFPEMVKVACKRMDVKPERTIVIGDSNGDMLLGRNAKSLSSIGIVSKEGQSTDHLINADAIIRDYTNEFIKIG
ncbi:HAD family hydrolase [Salirhabdus salicampi]|uniref:HAD family hydrolase n=1 Tax=Salirhabdus salicampi TaxID=476102 RepID=UPI0020C2BCAA|nr:HAD family phosphatase [Salirhabdus salicampi]MCP8615840.1 HAD family phosphatase [Salirhabdus salicampi]